MERESVCVKEKERRARERERDERVPAGERER